MDATIEDDGTMDVADVRCRLEDLIDPIMQLDPADRHKAVLDFVRWIDEAERNRLGKRPAHGGAVGEMVRRLVPRFAR